MPSLFSALKPLDDLNLLLNEDSTIDVPVGHGLGVTIDEAALKQFALSEMTLKAE